MIVARVGVEFTTQDGIVLWRVYRDALGEKVVGPWQQTAPELGFSAPIESNDRRSIERLQLALHSRL